MDYTLGLFGHLPPSRTSAGGGGLSVRTRLGSRVVAPWARAPPGTPRFLAAACLVCF